MRSRSGVRGRLGTSPAPSGQRRLGGVLALQRMAGNRAVRALIARDAKVIKIGNESVRVSSDAEKAEAERIIKDVKTKFGVSFDSLAAHKATMADSEGSAPEDRRKALAVRPWELDELQAIERALTHFAPVLGEARKKTMPKGPPQEFVNVGKLNSSPDDDPKILGDRTRGQSSTTRRRSRCSSPAPTRRPATTPWSGSRRTRSRTGSLTRWSTRS